MKHQGKAEPPILVIHGGAGSRPMAAAAVERRRAVMAETIAQVWSLLVGGAPAVEAVCRAVERMEASPHFNAGLGATIQSDGLVRLSASLMDGNHQNFSGVMLATHLIHPSKLAYALQKKENTVVGPLGAQLLARELGIAPENPLTVEQAAQWVSYLQKKDADPHGTVGAVAMDRNGCLAAATSTGGSGASTPDRISDSATVAGNYASKFAAISCTGVGEHIVNDGVAVRLETRVRDGKSMVEASELAYHEANELQRLYGWIGVDCNGHWSIYCATDHMSFGVMSPQLAHAVIQ